ncbi:ROK family protein [Nocardia sp. NPDC056100]|uniref:ROK family transcriptional regulator n=1 Tax=Nocardia sp. NPDC056100 TaxID=3345712 RepID=UPI0035E200AD
MSAGDAALRGDLARRPADSAAVRRRNLGAVLRHIAEHGACARTDIAAATGLAHGSVTALVGDLIERGLVREDDALRSGGRGRPGRPLRLVARRALSVAVQITSEQLRVVVADLGGVIVWRESAAHHSAPGRPESMADAVAAAVLRAGRFAVAAMPVTGSGGSDSATGSSATIAAAPGDARSEEPNSADSVLVRIVIAMAGPVRDDAAQTVMAAADFGWLRPVRLGELVGERLPGIGCPIDVVNDGNSAALAEYHARARRGRLVLIEAGTGIGGGVVLNGRIEIGSHGVAGEPGHLPVALDGPVCLCGARGCLVLYAGPEAVLTAAGLGEELAHAGLETAAARLIDALAVGDPRAVRALETAGHALGAAILGITALLDVDEVVLGGLLAQWFPWLEPTITARLAGRRALARGVELGIGPAVLGEDAMLLGAIEFARRTVLSDPATVPVRVDSPGI